MSMNKWVWIAPLLVAAGCSRNPEAKSQAQQPVAGGTQAAATVPAPNPEAVAQPDPPPPAAAAIVIPRGTPLRVRIDEAISTRRNLRGDRFTATLSSPVVVNGQPVLPSGTRLSGHVLVSAASGRFKGRARLVLALDSFEHNGRRYSIDTTAAARVSGSHKKRNLVAIGGGSAAGATVGAIAGGGAGALIGAGAGAVAGTVGAAVTGKKQVTLPAESIVRFTLGAPVRV
jgi:hypothetical protein